MGLMDLLHPFCCPEIVVMLLTTQIENRSVPKVSAFSLSLSFPDGQTDGQLFSYTPGGRDLQIKYEGWELPGPMQTKDV